MKDRLCKSFPRWKWASIGAALAAALTLGACRHGGWHDHESQFEQDPEQAAKRINKLVAWVLDDVDASAEQKQQVAAIAQAAVKDLLPLRDQHRALRTRAVELLTQAVIDRDAIEALRVETMHNADQVSRRLALALADTAQVLSVGQRAKLVARWNRHMG
jgi:Spy/CpxP family protein refolding chaperone